MPPLSTLLLGLVAPTIVLGTALPHRQHIRAPVLSPGCGSDPTITSGVQTISVNGQERQFTIHVPENYQNDQGHRLVYGLHWVGGTMDQVASGGTTGLPWAYFGLQVKSNDTAILVAPQGINNGWANSGGEDIAFIDAMNEYIDAGLCVDQGQRFAMGFSYGASMSYAIACARANDFRAVTVIAGGELSGCDGGTDPIAYFGIHGINDGTLPIDGGRALRDRFVTNNGCDSMDGAEEPTPGSRTHITTDATGCMAGYPVKWAAHDGGHIQGAADAPYPEEDGVNTWVPEAVWEFYTSPELSGA
ncbi:alpha/beta hydrolase family esterase [Aspergillus lucknowensis]|uniref:Feruloyl esterase C n=1 Tax=Aspergillus lucknowensis TaxID=176173 RepID=A0ABR4LHP3_9EURO